MKQLVSLNDLAARLGIPRDKLLALAANPRGHYKTIRYVDKKKGKTRILQVPGSDLKQVQARIKKNILDKLGVSGPAHGGVRGKSPRTNATNHLGQPCLINLDVKNFFPKVRHYVVYRMFRADYGFGRDVAHVLTTLVTLRSQLPQGTPTSTGIANALLARPVDRPLARMAANQGTTYTRFVDDIALSGPNPRALINAVGKLLSRRRLSLHRPKTGAITKLRISSNNNRQEVTGLVVNSSRGLSVSKRRRDQVRAAIHSLRKLSAAERAAAVRSIEGRINYVRQFNPNSARRLSAYLQRNG